MSQTPKRTCSTEGCGEVYYSSGCCRRHYEKQRYLINREKEAARKAAFYRENRDKVLARNKRYRDADIERERARGKKYRDHHAEKLKQKAKIKRAENLEKERERCRAKYYANKAKYFENTARRRSRKLSATPSWLTDIHFKQIQLFYEAAVAYSELLQMKIHVDHIVPLQGDIVSGLHVPWNLQLLPAPENLSKGNKFL